MTILRTDVLERLSRIVRQERGALVAVARGEGLDAEEAVECVQDALATFLSREEIDAENEIASLKTIVRNAARNFRRLHRRRMSHAPIDDQPLVAKGVDAEALLEERSGEDVANVLGITRKHVDVLVFRAKASLRVCMRHAQ